MSASVLPTPRKGAVTDVSPILTISIDEACRISGLGRSSIYDLMSRGLLASTKVRKRRLIRLDSLQALLGITSDPAA